MVQLSLMAHAVGNRQRRVERDGVAGDSSDAVELIRGSVAVCEPTASAASLGRDDARGEVVNILIRGLMLLPHYAIVRRRPNLPVRPHDIGLPSSTGSFIHAYDIANCHTGCAGNLNRLGSSRAVSSEV